MEIYKRKRVKYRPVVLKKIMLYTSFKILAPLAKKLKIFSTMSNFKIPSREAVTVTNLYKRWKKNRRRS